MKISIKPVKTKSELNRFIKFPWKIYKNDPYWVPPLIMESKKYLNQKKNPFLKNAKVQLFIAYIGKEPVGTIGACVNYNHNMIHKDTTGFFGFFEAINDVSISKLLFDTAGQWLKENGMTVMRGPMNFSVHDPCGLLIDGFDSLPAIMMTYNPVYYVDLVSEYGFTKSTDLYAYRVDREGRVIPEYLKQVAKEVEAIPGIRIKNLNYSGFAKEFQFIKDLYNSAMSRNWGYLPLSHEEFEYTMKSLKPIIVPDMVFFVYFNDDIVGFILPLPDINILLKKLNGRLFPTGIFKLLLGKKNVTGCRVFAIGIKPDYHDKRIGALLYLKFTEALLEKFKHGEYLEASWINESNKPMNRALNWLGLSINKTYRIYDYSLF